MTVKPSTRTPEEPSGLVIRTSQTRLRPGPPLLAVTVPVIVLASTKTTLDVAGAGPDPFSNVTSTPAAKPEPLIVTSIMVPDCIVFGAILVTLTPAASSVKVTVAVSVIGAPFSVPVTVAVPAVVPAVSVAV